MDGSANLGGDAGAQSRVDAADAGVSLDSEIVDAADGATDGNNSQIDGGTGSSDAQIQDAGSADSGGCAGGFCDGGAWGIAELIETDDTGGASSAQVAFDGSGNALALWRQFDGLQYSIYSNRYEVGTGWQTPTLVEHMNFGNADSFAFSFDGNGRALAVWSQSDGTRRNMYSSVWEAANGWSSPADLIETDDAGDAESPALAFDQSGNAVSVWNQSDGVQRNIWANRYDATAGWGTAELIETDPEDALATQVKFDPNGDAISLWVHYSGAFGNIRSNRFISASGWNSPEPVEFLSDDAIYPRVGFDGNGTAIALWRQQSRIWSAQYDEINGWGLPELVSTSTGATYIPNLEFDGSGNALAVWFQSDGIRDNIWANRYQTGTGWGTAQLIETNNAGRARNAHLAVNQAGDALAVWQQSDGTTESIWANRYDIATGWGAPQLIETDDTGDARSAHAAIDANGNGMVVWEQSDGMRFSIWANRLE